VVTLGVLSREIDLAPDLSLVIVPDLVGIDQDLFCRASIG
jgi:hypothetical protein